MERVIAARGAPNGEAIDAAGDAQWRMQPEKS
jgi:hypothetical protein